MKILHTSDWHVGRTLRGRSRATEHEAVLGEVAKLAATERADLVLVTGDIFDSAAPTAEAERIAYRALLDLASTGATVIVIAGNHDNDRRLQAVEPLLGLGRIVTRSTFARPADGGVVEIETAGGEVAVVALLPFLSQRYVIRADQLMNGDAADHASAYADRMHRLVDQLCASFRSDTVNIVAAHLFVANGLLGGGERSAHTILEYAVPATVFPAAAHYAALGHLHRQQRIAGACPIWYAGSPMQLDFGEVADVKATLLVDAEPGRPCRVSSHPVRAGRRLRTVSGTLGELAQIAAGGADDRDDVAEEGSRDGHERDDYLKVIVREPARAGLADHVRNLLPAAVDIVVAPPEGFDSRRQQRESRRGRSPQELFAAYLSEQQIADGRLDRLFSELLDEQLSPAAGADDAS